MHTEMYTVDVSQWKIWLRKTDKNKSKNRPERSDYHNMILSEVN